jgi:protein TonB
MSYLINNQQKINEIVFAGRNKNYGAYVIRSEYGSTLLKSLSIMLLAFGAVISVSFYLVHRNNNDMKSEASISAEQDSSITVEVNMNEKKPEPPAVPEPPARNNSGSSAIATVISETASANTNTVLNENTGVRTNTNTEGPPGPATSTTETGTLTAPTNTANDTYYVADSNPEYEGGLKALYAFLSARLKYPEPAFENGKEGTVFVRFVVDQSGKVCNLSLLNHLGLGLDEEALRVASMIPNFKTPGMMAGKPVRVYYQLPVKFNMR